MTLSDLQILTALHRVAPNLPVDIAAKIRLYINLLLRWNSRVNLTAITDPAEILERHFVESILAVEATPIREGHLIDVGSGAGFPGLAIKLAVPALHVTLLEPTAKKRAFLSEIVSHLELANVRISSQLAGSKVPPIEPPADFITCRAVGKLTSLLNWSARSHSPTGQVVLWLGEAGVTEAQSAPAWTWRSPIPIQNSKNRALLIGRPTK